MDIYIPLDVISPEKVAVFFLTHRYFLLGRLTGNTEEVDNDSESEITESEKSLSALVYIRLDSLLRTGQQHVSAKEYEYDRDEVRGISCRGLSWDHNMPKQTKFVCFRLFWHSLVWQWSLTQFKGFRYIRIVEGRTRTDTELALRVILSPLCFSTPE
jgi:hypothetical protein